MIPSVLALHIRRGVEDFLRTTFPVSTPFFEGIFERLFSKEGSIFKGPYLDIQLPFQNGKGGPDYFPDLPMPYPPYLHQERAFDRLGSKNPLSTLVATGTGSGKTECFLYPILNYCFQNRGEPGIKAIIIYPMNALATDQAGRLASLIWNSKLKGNVTAGLYVGQNEKDMQRVMGADSLISNKEALRQSPPDILLTNYKMLDYLLVRPVDKPLWSQNKSETLRFLVVDELHSFDGAQGSDLGCLVRRLKSRLGTPENHLCCVGTSATLGEGDKKNALQEYAETLLGESFDKDALIKEARLSAGDFLDKSFIKRIDIVPLEKSEDLNPDNYKGYKEYVSAQHKLWFDEDLEGEFSEQKWGFDLCDKIKEHLLFQNLLKTLAGKTAGFDDILAKLDKTSEDFSKGDTSYKVNLLNSLLSLVSEARLESGRPFLNVRLQVWLRELRRMVCDVGKTPALKFAADLSEEQLEAHLPLVHCRECGSMGWAGLKRKNSTSVGVKLQDFYHAFFKHDPKVVFIFPEENTVHVQEPNVGHQYLCPDCLNVTVQEKPGACPSCDGKNSLPVFMPDARRKRGRKLISVNDCPHCESANSLSIVGSRAASLTSVMIAQLYSSNFNDDKKLLTFSDNVQDAAHRTGFFNARTYRFTFRTCLQQVVMNTEKSYTLADLSNLFIDYWSEKMDKNRYLATFLGPNMEWFSDFEHLKTHGSLPPDSTLKSLVDKRIGWEIMSEYGFRARIGRTLEKTTSSVAFLDPTKVKECVNEVLEIIQNEFEAMREISPALVHRFILGFVVHLKNQGGIFHSALAAYIEGFGNTYKINTTNWMPGFGVFSRTPAFLTTRKNERFDQLLGMSATRRTWYQGWVEKCFYTFNPLVLAESGKIYEVVLGGMVKSGLLFERVIKKDPVWGLKPEAFRISLKVLQLRCVRCGHSLSVAEEEKEAFLEAPCQRFRCHGIYKPAVSEIADYYGKLYQTGDVERIFSEEHTGLLERKPREDLERQFKSSARERQPWYPNLLSCTPTLEMGIDIGDLSSLILCSVPPAQSNYVQRIGRAGRRDGNGLNITVANGRPHDLYFYAEPEEMLAGHMDPPGVFINASAVLERQFTAFCFDRWIASEEDTHIPARLGEVLNNLESHNSKKFPYNLVQFIETNQTRLFDQFKSLFTGKVTLDEEACESLRTFIEGEEETEEGLRIKIVHGLFFLNKELESLKRKVRTLTQKIRKKQTAPKDQNYKKEMQELLIEKSALQGLIKNIRDRNIFNYFTDQGLIPNYAFPEAGVVLNSLIYRKKQKVQDGEGSYDTWSYKYERAASSAISELAPANSFYAGKRSVRVDQVDMTLSDLETWRFCPNCSNKVLFNADEDTDNCPACGDDLWGNEGQKRLMLKMRQVFASTSDKESRIADDSDDREPTFYNRQMLLGFDEKRVIDAYKVNGNYPFGFDFLSNVNFCEINFGEKTEVGEENTIAGVEGVRKGFRICRTCGKVQENNKTGNHALTCTARNKDDDKSFIECVYLYRQFTSEAIRILLPVSILSGSDKQMHSFVAALQLGLKRMFKGKIDHLQTTIHEEPLVDSVFKKKYLVLYDTIPGGTGYLKQLMRSETPMINVMEEALSALRSCSCNQTTEDKDGCYRCLYAYRNSYTLSETSRDTAVEILAEILQHRENLVKTETIKNISVNTLFDSELEARFIEAFRQQNTSEKPILLKKELVIGKPGYFLKINERAYTIEPQVKLGEAEGIEIPSKADFIIRPARIREQVPPVVIFLDGYTYHKERIDKDLAQRMAIARTGKYVVWSLTWKDVENSFKTQGNYFENYLNPSELPAGDKFNSLLDGYGMHAFKDKYKRNNFDLLVSFLQNPDRDKWRLYAFVCGLLYIKPEIAGEEKALSDWEEEMRTNLTEEMAAVLADLKDPRLYGVYKSKETENPPFLHVHMTIENQSVSPPPVIQGLKIGCSLNDRKGVRESEGFQRSWNGFLRLYNIFNFLPHAFFVTSQGIENHSFSKIDFADEKFFEESREQRGIPDAWQDAYEFTDMEYHSLIDFIRNHKWPVPEVVFELENKDGEIVAQAELGWQDFKIAFLSEAEFHFKQIFEVAGWRTFQIKDLLSHPELCVELYKSEGEPKPWRKKK